MSTWATSKVERAELEAEAHRVAGRPFTVGGHKQVGTVLFEEMKLPVRRRTKTGYSTAAHVLERLADQHPLVGVVLQWRTVDKLINTYTEVLGKAHRPVTPAARHTHGGAGPPAGAGRLEQAGERRHHHTAKGPRRWATP